MEVEDTVVATPSAIEKQVLMNLSRKIECDLTGLLREIENRYLNTVCRTMGHSCDVTNAASTLIGHIRREAFEVRKAGEIEAFVKKVQAAGLL